MRAAFYECDVTPPLGGYMRGYGKKRIALDVKNRLYARAAVVENNGEIIAIVAIDTVNILKGMHKIVTDRIYEYTGIEPSRVCITSTHTHTGAPIFDNPEIDCYSDKAYTDVFLRLTADAVILAYKRLEEVTVKFGVAPVEGIAFNRNFIFEDGVARTNFRRPGRVRPFGGTDPDLSVVTFEKDGDPVGSIINFSCHSDCTGFGDAYSGDYTSAMEDELKKAYGQKFVSLFALAPCGDINHIDVERTDREGTMPKNWHREMGKILSSAALDIMKKSVPIDGSVAVKKETIRLKRRVADDDYINDRLRKIQESGDGIMRIRSLLNYRSMNTEEYSELYLQVIKIGDLCLHILPGEIYVKFALDIKKNSTFPHNVVIENANSPCGYIPTKDAFDSKHDIYGTMPTPLGGYMPEAGDMMVEKILKMSEELRKEN